MNDQGKFLRRALRWTALSMVAAWLPQWAVAAYSCTVSSTGVTVASHSSIDGAARSTSGTATVTCTRAGTDSRTTSFSLGVSGGNLSGVQRRARIGSTTSYLNYDLWQDSAASVTWANAAGDTGSRFKTIDMAFSSNPTASASVNLTYYLKVPAGQTGAVGGAYTDTVTLSLYATNAATATLATTTFPVSITVPQVCTLSSSPTKVSFAYRSFQTTDATANTSFGVTCTNGTAYTPSLDSYSGTMLGLDYSLSLSPSGQRTGTGSALSTAINGTMAKGQSGVCTGASCTASATRTLTITY